ncbi:MAG: tyrosine-protein phosphatase [Ilumatobacter sp.]|uniref:tyrosine-protein phosphatase n=1 Tax=Ilumatobacter sp. TaxID=1967498 RepID=UPI00391C3398
MSGTLNWVFEELSNFRGLGGHVTSDGRTLKSGLVYRSDALCFVTENDRAVLRDILQIQTIVDLRTSMEHERMGRYDLADVGEVVHLPVLDGALIRENAHNGSLDLPSMYQAIVFDHADEIAAVLTLLSDPDRLPAVISCTAGKDRTGIIVATLLAVLDVPDEAILADYEQSTAGLAMLRDRIITRLVGDDLARIPPAAFAVEPAALAEVLQDIRTRHGTITNYLIAAGAPADIRQRLSALLDNGDAVTAPACLAAP